MAYKNKENHDCIPSNKVFPDLGMDSLVSFAKPIAAFTSFGIHIAFFLVVFDPDWFSQETKSNISLQNGDSQTSFFLERRKMGSSDFLRQDDLRLGTKSEEEEIQEFQNCLSYPKLAIEQGLEDDCTVSVQVGENGKAVHVTEKKPCRYSIFSQQIGKQITEWKFQEGKKREILLPIRFRLKVKDDGP